MYTKRFGVRRLVEHNLKDRIGTKEQLGQCDTNMIIMTKQVHIIKFLKYKGGGGNGGIIPI